jgi:hypothetical protein
MLFVPSRHFGPPVAFLVALSFISLVHHHRRPRCRQSVPDEELSSFRQALGHSSAHSYRFTDIVLLADSA